MPRRSASRRPARALRTRPHPGGAVAVSGLTDARRRRGCRACVAGFPRTPTTAKCWPAHFAAPAAVPGRAAMDGRQHHGVRRLLYRRLLQLGHLSARIEALLICWSYWRCALCAFLAQIIAPTAFARCQRAALMSLCATWSAQRGDCSKAAAPAATGLLAEPWRWLSRFIVTLSVLLADAERGPWCVDR